MVLLWPILPPDVLSAQMARATRPVSSNGNNPPSNGDTKPAVVFGIVYGLAGIFVLIFIAIIVTAKVRVHRHPERYGPRRGEPGRPKQSRVKGLARAVLDTIPIVKFGESYDRDADGAAHGDVELAGAGETNRTQATTSQTNTSPTLPVTAAGGLSAVGTVGVECSICTEDFVNSEDIRVLPCNHKFHPTCIDPWLLNISGTCPLCRMDLCPTITSDNTANSANDFLSPPLGDEADIAESRSRISRYNDLRHAAHSGPEVRLAALRGLYQSHRASASAPAETVGPRRSRLASRLRDTFSIRTRQSGAQGVG